MTERELFSAIMHYEPFDRMFTCHWQGWEELDREWEAQGIPRGKQAEHFGACPLPRRVAASISLYPALDTEILEETDEYRIIRDGAGVVMKDWKDRSCIPQFLEHTLRDRESWETHFRPRLQPAPERLGEKTWAEVEAYRDRDFPVCVSTGSMIGWIRNWMGVEGLAYLQADDPELIGEMVDTIATMIIATIEPIVDKLDPKPELGWAWEDICCKSGPLVSPSIFERYVVPGYREISDMLLSYGVDLHLVDCDGVIDALVPLWLEGGVNLMFPIEIGVWDADPMAFRREYGKELRVFGGIDKRVLYEGPEAIDAEIERRLPLMKEGGFIPLPDHLIPPGVSVENYRHYIDRIRSLRF